MIIKTPTLTNRELDAVDQIWQIQKQIAPLVSEPNRWNGLLRRQAISRAVQASNSIEGFEATLPQVQALLLNGSANDLTQNTQSALTGYHDAMTFVIQLSKDARLTLDETFVKSCHFMLTKDDLTLRPGRFRAGPVYVHNATTREIVFEGAPANNCQKLVEETLAEANAAADEFDIVAAAMAHLNLVLIHPFKDGNGRMARILQSAVLARTNRLSPVYLSIEEYLATNTQSYYAALAKTGGERWNPTADATAWVRFCLEAHWQQANAVKLNANRTNLLWVKISELVEKIGMNARTIAPLVHVATGNQLTNETYRSLVQEQGDPLSMLTASRDLAALCVSDFLEPRGENRARHYSPGETLRRVVGAVEREVSARRAHPLF